MRVKIYYNLHKHCLSVLHKTKKGWRLKEHRQSINLCDVKFTVNETSRQRVIREKRKNVHAFIEGTEVNEIPELTYKVTYNPYKYSNFMKCIGDIKTPVTTAQHCSISGRHVMI